MELVQTDESILDIAEHVFNIPVVAVSRIRIGGNNQIYRLRGRGQDFALKFYPPQAEDQRDRLGLEFSALKFMSSNGVKSVPMPIAMSRQTNCALYEWVDGTVVNKTGVNDIESMIALVGELAELRNTVEAAGLSPASASCLNKGDPGRQLEARLERLTLAGEHDPSLDRFLSSWLEPAVKTARQTYERNNPSWRIPSPGMIPQAHQTISPSDFGFHNALRLSDGSLVFVDFEYFGWDDAVKMVCDVLLHPGMNLEAGLKQKFFAGVELIFDPTENGEFRRRVIELFPIFRLIWCTILLNEFLPDTWHRRQLARGGNLDEQKATQLAKALAMIEDPGHEHDLKLPN